MERWLGRLGLGIFAIGLWLSIAGTALAARVPGISVDGVWCRISTEKTHTGFVYMTLSIAGGEGDQLVGATSPVARTVDMLAPQQVKGREKLQRTSSIALDPHFPTVLQPQGPHLILHGIRQKLAPGDNFVLTLEFAKAGKRDVTAKIVSHPPHIGLPELPKGVKLD
ncbi:MAG TPA: copper chaperone PCu(A)C [Aliidongia sp.]|nr:copper chaperone PCu(A)C [Aliidongia sp.]